MIINHRDWITVDVPEMHCLPKAIYLRSQQLATKHVFPLHIHPWHQFVYATSGSLVVTVNHSWYVITPEQAIWLPAGVWHATGALSDTAFRNLYVADTPQLNMPTSCTVFSVSAFFRALIIELEDAQTRKDSETYIDKLNELISEQLKRLSKQDFYLPWPHSPILCTICESLYADPADTRSVEAWGQLLGASSRTLTRRFEKEVGMSLRDWRYRLRLFRAVEWLCAGRSITNIAFALGYASTSAFTYMFRQEMGCTPSAWLNR
ncbi:DNA-binding domain-containing protein, AraC-type [Beggiatoa alba B18LD]|uniref:DNA-binding domain-containing protein, AraC-type n=1 Tax=Beggiatoa alba B18LD TaxID=395493 RepID=I3CD49_9GAMM|nr:helix-turn-helix transcriptional regulator [Beggiatoa alba]EIJ41542.1 DNA-binding domain-containing protein, AraC-type [Beggiatoa alba B18LD]